MFFTEFENYVDGGVMANNPSDAALARIQQHYRGSGQKLPISCVVSLGSGLYPAVKLGNTGKCGWCLTYKDLLILVRLRCLITITYQTTVRLCVLVCACMHMQLCIMRVGGWGEAKSYRITTLTLNFKLLLKW